MMRLLYPIAIVAAFSIVAMVAQGPGRAALTPPPSPGGSGIDSAVPALELLVFEADRCEICEIFHRDVAPGYALAPIARTAPMRFVDIAKVDLGHIGLSAGLEILPTAVLMQNGREVARVPGLTSPATFYAVLRHMIAKTDTAIPSAD